MPKLDDKRCINCGHIGLQEFGMKPEEVFCLESGKTLTRYLVDCPECGKVMYFIVGDL